jgi:hypothetical protein
LVWLGSAQGLSLLFLAAGNSHLVFLDESHNHVRLVLHHPGIHDQHEGPQTAPLTHRHDLLDRALATASGGSIPEEDHVIDLHDQKEQAITATKIIGHSKEAFPQVTVYVWPMIVKPSSVHLFSHSPPQLNPTLVTLRTTILLI